MNAKTKILSDAVKSALGALSVRRDGARYLVTMPELGREDYLATNQVLQEAGGTWSRRDKAHVFATDPTESLARFRDQGKMLRKKDEFSFFPTPASVATTAVDALLAGGYQPQTILEPSAGDGALIRAVRAKLPDVTIKAIEIDPSHGEALSRATAGAGKSAVTIGDFLKLESDLANQELVAAHAVLMNPPYDRNTWLKHVLAAMRVLDRAAVHMDPSNTLGRIVAILPGIAPSALKAKIASNLSSSRWSFASSPLPSRSFAESGTYIHTCVVTLDRRS